VLWAGDWNWTVDVAADVAVVNYWAQTDKFFKAIVECWAIGQLVIASIPVTIRTGGFHCNKSFTTHVPLLTTMHVSPLAVNYWATCYTFEVNCSTAVGCELCRALVFHWFGSLHILFCSALTCCFVIVWFTVISSLRTFCWSRPGAVASRYHVLSHLLVCANTVSNFKLAPLENCAEKKLENLRRELLQKCTAIQENVLKLCLCFTVQVWSKMIMMNNNCLF